MLYRFLDCTLDTDRREFQRGGNIVPLRPRVYALLVYLLENRERAVSKDDVLHTLWGKRIVSDATLSSCIKELRRAVGESGQTPRVVQTLYGHGFRFIASLEPEPAPEATTPTPSIEPLREFKQVTVLAGSVPDAELHAKHLGAETMHEAMRAVNLRVREAVQRYGGVVAEWSGAGFVALFGAPVALEDHARRAVQAALELAHATDSALPAQRLALDTGAVLVGHLEGDIYTAPGETTAHAQRLMADAKSGAVLASGSTWQLVESEVEAEPANGNYHIRAISVGRSGVPTRPDRLRTQFVGRGRELELLRDRLVRARHGRGHTTCIVADAGLGKSRLVEEFRRHALEPGGIRSVAAHCFAHHATTPYRAMATLLRGLCDCSDRDPHTVVIGKLEQALRAARVTEPDAPELLMALLEIPGSERFVFDLAPETRRSRTFRYLTTMVLRGANDTPCALVVEDLHWIDATSEAWLAELVARAENARLLVVLTCRPGYRPPWSASSAITQLALDPLDARDSAALIGAMPGAAPLSANATTRIVAAAQGNPFFLEELAWALIERGPASEAGHALPASVHAVIGARIDQLDVVEKQLVQIASTFGARFAMRLLAAVSALDAASLEKSLAVLETRGFVYECGTSDAREYAFRHVLTQDVAYQSLPVGVRARLHQRIADTLEQHFPSFAAAQPEVLAPHWSGAGRPDRAFAYWQRAAHRAIERSAHLEAIAHLNCALQANSALPRTIDSERERLEVRLMLGAPLMATQGFAAQSVQENYAEASELCKQAATDAQRFVAAWGFFLHCLHSGRISQARSLVSDIFELAQRIDQPEYWLQAHHAGWTFESTHGDLNACLNHAEQGVRLYSPEHHARHAHLYGMHDPGLCAHGTAAEAAWFLGKPDSALERTTRTLELARGLTHPYSVLLAIIDLAWIRCVRLEPAECSAHAQEALELCAAENVPGYLAVAGILNAWARAMRGELDAGIEGMKECIASYRRLGLKRHLAFFWTLLAERLLRQGRPAEGFTVLDEAEALIGKTCERRWLAEVCRLRGLCLLQLGTDPQAAEASLHEALAISQEQQARMLELRAATSLAQSWPAKSQHESARALVQPLLDSFDEGLATPDILAAREACS